MPNFKRIEVQFGENDPKSRVVVVVPKNGVQAIFLEQAAIEAKKTHKMAPKGKKTTAIQLIGAESGPGDVCYLINGELHCWDPT